MNLIRHIFTVAAFFNIGTFKNDLVVKEKLCDIMKRCYDEKYITKRDGNISYLTTSNSYVISPGGVKKPDMKAEDFIEINVNDMTDQKKMNDKLRPSREIHFHHVLHNMHVKSSKGEFTPLCVLHAHPKNVVAFMKLKEHNVWTKELNSIKVIFPEFPYVIGKNIDYLTAGSTALAKDIEQKMKLEENTQICGMKNHGIIIVDESPDKAFEILETIDYYCDIVQRTTNSII